MSARRKSEIGVEERVAIFHESFDASIDAGVSVAALARGLGDYLGYLVGRADADAAMALIVARLAGREVAPDAWREALEENESLVFSEWPSAQHLHDLAAYAFFGIVLTGDDPDEAAAWIDARLEEVRSLLERLPLDRWLAPEQAEQLKRLALLAEARWALDDNRPVQPAAVADFGAVSAPRMRALMAGNDRTFHRDEDGLIPAHEALAWLAGRESFWNSIWREQPLPRHGLRDRPPLEAPVFVPVARDGSVFHPGLRRGGTYTIGNKGDEAHVEDFDAALRQLQAMPEPYWRRPGEKGAWGLVGGVRWERLDRDDLEGFATNPARRLAPAL